MKNNWSYKQSLAFLPLLSLFFVFHGYVDFFDLITLPAGSVLLLEYFAFSFLLLLVSRLFFRSWLKAGLLAFSLMAINFFFGSFQDGIKIYFANRFLDRYNFQLSFIAILLLVTFILLKRQKSDPTKLIGFLNFLFPLLLLMDTVTLIFKIKNNSADPTIRNYTPLIPIEKNSIKPDIFFIITDGYSGNRALNKLFNYDNSHFENELKKRDFYVADSSFSNYNYTLFSVASTLNMDYLRTKLFFEGNKDIPLAFNAIRKNKTISFLEKQGYRIFNYSIFDIKGNPTSLIRRLSEVDKSPLTSQMLTFRIWKDIGYHLVYALGLKIDKNPILLYTDFQNTQISDSFTRKVAIQQGLQPKFVYTHLMMPHVPYYFDSLGNPFSKNDLNEASQSDKNRYINYLVYTNKKILSLVDYILTNNKRPAIIVVLGDHGSRDCLENTSGEKMQSLNLNAVLLPNKDYKDFYKGMSNVNEFRIIFNLYFNQKLSLIKDSTVHIKIN